MGITRQAAQQAEASAFKKLQVKFLPELREINPALAAEVMRAHQKPIRKSKQKGYHAERMRRLRAGWKERNKT